MEKWTKKERFVSVFEEDGDDPRQGYAETGELIFVDVSDAITEYTGEQSAANTHVFGFTKWGVARFAWEFRYLSPAFSGLSGQEGFDHSDEKTFEKAAINFLDAYFPEVFPDARNNADVTFFPELEKCRVDFFRPGENASEAGVPAVSVTFTWDEFELELAGTGEKALIKEFVFNFPKIGSATEPIIPPEDAWKNACKAGNFNPSYTVVYDWLIMYQPDGSDVSDSRPYYCFLCSLPGNNTAFILKTPAVL